MARMLAHCPVCEGGLKITEVTCERCDTRVKSRFEPCRFCSLAPDHLAFLETFLRCEGNLSRVEKELGVSYPTVRNRLTTALSALGLTENTGAASPGVEPADATPKETVETLLSPEEIADRRRDALNSLARGEISADDAARILRELS